jgi:hypothetical protein
VDDGDNGTAICLHTRLNVAINVAGRMSKTLQIHSYTRDSDLSIVINFHVLDLSTTSENAFGHHSSPCGAVDVYCTCIVKTSKASISPSESG